MNYMQRCPTETRTPVQLTASKNSHIEPGDLVMIDAIGKVISIADAPGASDAMKIANAAASFVGVAKHRSPQGQGRLIGIATEGLFEFPCDADEDSPSCMYATFATSQTGLHPQKVGCSETPATGPGRLAYSPHNGKVFVYITSSLSRGITSTTAQAYGGAVSSVNGETGDVLLDIPTEEEIQNIAQAYGGQVNSVNGETGDVLLDIPSTPEEIGAMPVGITTITVEQAAAIVANSAKNSYPTADATKLSGIAAGAEVNVQADWDATSGDANIRNKPNVVVHPTAASITGTRTLTAADYGKRFTCTGSNDYAITLPAYSVGSTNKKIEFDFQMTSGAVVTVKAATSNTINGANLKHGYISGECAQYSCTGSTHKITEQALQDQGFVAGKTTTQAIPAGTLTTITWDSVDLIGAVTYSNGVFTLGAPGCYMGKLYLSTPGVAPNGIIFYLGTIASITYNTAFLASLQYLSKNSALKATVDYTTGFTVNPGSNGLILTRANNIIL